MVMCRRIFGVLLLVGWVFIFFIAPHLQEDLPALRTHVQEMKAEYPALDKVKYQFAHGSFTVDLYVSDMEGAEDMKQDLQTFLSGEAFQTEFLPLCEAEWEDSGSSGLMPGYPEIWITCYPQGEQEQQWASYAMYYTQPYRSDQILEVDGYQTWYDE